ncbi:MAG: hypothetical protein HYW25_01580 [Candidatus Aenigmarchaeota archaeon]|nr:hypothetical protein [Candidatus Aenigmarchaeota archaeon]
MRIVFEISGDKLSQAEQLLKKDDIVGRQSIAIRNASVLGLEGDIFIIIDGNEAAIKRAQELLKGIAQKSKKEDLVLKKYDELEEKAAEGFGAILGE